MLGLSYGVLRQGTSAPILVALLASLLLTSAPVASANQTGYVGSEGGFDAAVSDCGLNASTQEGAPYSSATGTILQPAAGQQLNTYELLDDGTITQWIAAGNATAGSSVKLDVLDKGFADHAEILQESSAATVFYATFSSAVNPTSLPVEVGDGIGVSVRAVSAGETSGKAEVECDVGGSEFKATTYGVWEPVLIKGNLRAPTATGTGQIAVAATVEYDAPVISSISSQTGSALGGEVVTVKGEHLANARAPEFGPENYATITENTNTTLKFTTPEAAEKEGVVSTSVKVRFATRGGAAALEPTYAYKGMVPSRKPQIVLGPATEITPTSALLHATVNIEGLRANVCDFTFASEAEEPEPEGTDEVCEPYPTAFSSSPQSVSAVFLGLTPDTTYHYIVTAAASWDARSGQAESEGSFKTSGSSGGGETSTPTGGTPSTPLSPIVSPAISPVLLLPPASPLAPALPLPIPAAALVGGGSLFADASGALPLKVSCPATVSDCVGSITVKSAAAIRAQAAGVAKKAFITMATGAFKITGGKTQSIKLHLSQKARALLGRLHSLRTRVTILAHNDAGTTHTTSSAATIHLEAKHA